MSTLEDMRVSYCACCEKNRYTECTWTPKPTTHACIDCDRVTLWPSAPEEFLAALPPTELPESGDGA